MWGSKPGAGGWREGPFLSHSGLLPPGLCPMSSQPHPPLPKGPLLACGHPHSASSPCSLPCLRLSGSCSGPGGTLQSLPSGRGPECWSLCIPVDTVSYPAGRDTVQPPGHLAMTSPDGHGHL